MLKTLRSKTAKIPSPLSSLALAIASLGWCMENAFELHGAGQALGASVSAVLVSLILCKFLLNPGVLLRELAHPLIGSIIPTCPMALMIVSKALGRLSPAAGEFVWCLAVFLHMCALLGFLYHRVRDGSLKQMVPSWFVPPVGIIMSVLTLPGEHFVPLAYGLLVFGMVSYACLLPLMMRRLMSWSSVEGNAKPTLVIMAAPASLSLAGYLTIEPDPSLLFCGILLGIALLMTSAVYLALFKLLKLPFSPAYAAFTFPLVIGSTALYKVAGYLENFPAAARYAEQISLLAGAEMVVASLVVLYVCLRYIWYYMPHPHHKESSHNSGHPRAN